MRRRPHELLLPARLLLAFAAGLAIWLALPGNNQWYAAWLGCALLAAAGWAAGFRWGLLIGLLAGWAYFVPTLAWSGIYVGPLPWLALATLEALYIAVMVGVVGWLQRRLVARGRDVAAYAVVPLAWVVGEWARGTTPFGGFPWARLAFSQADSPIRNLAALGGAPLLTAAVATIGVLTYAVARAALVTRRPLPAVASIAGVAALALGSLLIPLPTTAGAPTAEIALVQGNVPKPGLDFNSERRAVLDLHARATETLAASGVRPDLVVWPENAVDIDPLRNPDAAAEIIAAQNAIQAPLLVGAILEEPEPYVSNASLLYRPGVVDPERYVKQHPVPFAEYVPYRDFFRHFSDKVDLVRAGMATGTEIGYFEVATKAGQTFAALPTICFEVAYDGLIRAAVTHNASLPSVLVVQTNNATFGFTDESEQQYAISRIRAIEHGRAVVHVSTVGVSGFVAPDGTSGPLTTLFTQATQVAAVPLLSGLTVADRIGGLPEYLALAGLFVAFGRTMTRSHDNGSTPAPPAVSKELVGA